MLTTHTTRCFFLIIESYIPSGTRTMNMNTVTLFFPSLSTGCFPRNISIKINQAPFESFRSMNGEELGSHKAWVGSITKFMVRNFLYPCFFSYRSTLYFSTGATRITISAIEDPSASKWKGTCESSEEEVNSGCVFGWHLIVLFLLTGSPLTRPTVSLSRLF